MPRVVNQHSIQDMGYTGKDRERERESQRQMKSESRIERKRRKGIGEVREVENAKPGATPNKTWIILRRTERVKGRPVKRETSPIV